MSGYGLIENPWDLATAIRAGLTRPGSLFYLRGGTYTGDFVATAEGSQTRPITFRAYPGERPIIDGRFEITGAYTYWHDIEFTYSAWTNRSTEIEGSGPADIPYTKVVEFHAPNSKLINCIIHDMAGGPYFGQAAIGSEIYGCLIYNNGWSGPDRGHGHSFYTQNRTGIKHIRDCIAFNSFSTGLKIYTVNEYAQGYNIAGNTIFNSSVLWDGDDYGMNYWVQHGNDEEVGTGYTFDNNMSYHALETGDPVTIGLYDYAYGVRLRNNYFPEGIIKNCEILEETGNTYGVIGNTYFMRQNEYNVNRANLTIYNEAQADSVTVDVSSVFDPGDVLTVRNVQDYWVDTQELTVSEAGTIAVDMRAVSHTVARPVGTEDYTPATTFPKFGAFVAEKTA